MGRCFRPGKPDGERSLLVLAGSLEVVVPLGQAGQAQRKPSLFYLTRIIHLKQVDREKFFSRLGLVPSCPEHRVISRCW